MRILKTVVLGFLLIALMQIAFAANVGVVISLPDGTSVEKCVSIKDNGNAADAIQRVPSLLDYWTGSGSTLTLSKISTWINNDNSNSKYWTFFNNNGSNSYFSYSASSWGLYKIPSTGHVIGAIYTNMLNKTRQVNVTDAYGNSTLVNETYLDPASKPNFVAYTTLCQDWLSIKDIKVYVDGKEKTAAGATGGIIADVKPESTVKFTIELDNTYDSDSDTAMTAYAKGTIESIDDGDDLEEESSDVEIDAGDSKKMTLEFKIPLKLEQDTYSLKLVINGEDDNNLAYEYEIDYEIDIKKERHDVRINKAELNPSTVSCFKKANVDIGVLNLGLKEEDVSLYITSADLGIDYYTNFTLVEDPSDSDSEYSNTFNFNLNSTVARGSYPISARITYDDGQKSQEKSLTLTVTDCASQTSSRTSAAAPRNAVSTSTDSAEVVIKNQASQASQAASQPASTETGFDSGILITILVVAGFLILGAGIVIVVLKFV